MNICITLLIMVFVVVFLAVKPKPTIRYQQSHKKKTTTRPN